MHIISEPNSSLSLPLLYSCTQVHLKPDIFNKLAVKIKALNHTSGWRTKKEILSFSFATFHTGVSHSKDKSSRMRGGESKRGAHCWFSKFLYGANRGTFGWLSKLELYHHSTSMSCLNKRNLLRWVHTERHTNVMYCTTKQVQSSKNRFCRRMPSRTSWKAFSRSGRDSNL